MSQMIQSSLKLWSLHIACLLHVSYTVRLCLWINTGYACSMQPYCSITLSPPKNRSHWEIILLLRSSSCKGTVHKWRRLGGGRGVSEKLTKVDIGGKGGGGGGSGRVPYKVDINHDAVKVKGWGEKSQSEEKLLMWSRLSFLGLEF